MDEDRDDGEDDEDRDDGEDDEDRDDGEDGEDPDDGEDDGAEESGGDPACWLSLTCEECGAILDGSPHRPECSMSQPL